MLIVVLLVLAMTCTAAGHNVPTFPWSNRPQLVAFTFEGSLTTSSDALALLPSFSNGRLSCQRAVPATWFATDCTPDLQSLQSNHVEIAAFSNNETTIACLRANAIVKGLRSSSSGAANSSFEYNLVESSSYLWPFADADGIKDVPFVSVDEIGVMAALAQSYDGPRTPIVISLTDLVTSIGHDAAAVITQKILALDDIVAVTTAQLSELATAQSAAEAEAIVNVCRSAAIPATNTTSPTLTPSTLTPSTLMTSAPTSSPSASPTPTRSASEGATPTPSPGPSARTDRPGSPFPSASSAPSGYVPSSNTSSTPTSARPSTENGTSTTNGNATNAGAGPATAVPTAAPTATPTTAVAATPVPTTPNVANQTNRFTTAPSTSSIKGSVPGSPAPTDSSQGASDSSSSSAKSTGYVPYVIGIGGGLCAMAVAIVYKVFKREDRFPPIVTNGYVFEAEDREIYDLEAHNNSVRVAAESREPSSSYIRSDLESASQMS